MQHSQENNKIRESAKRANVPLWKIADALGVSEATMTRSLRRELSAQKEAEILSIIERLSLDSKKGE